MQNIVKKIKNLYYPYYLAQLMRKIEYKFANKILDKKAIFLFRIVLLNKFCRQLELELEFVQ